MRLDPAHENGDEPVQFRFGERSPLRDVVPLFQAGAAAASGGVLGDEAGVSPHRGLAAVAGRIGGGEPQLEKPAALAGDDMVRQAKDEMYRALRNTLLSFGAYVIMSSVSNIYPQAAVWSGIASSLAAGVSVVNLMDFLHDCMVYYDSARAVYL